VRVKLLAADRKALLPVIDRMIGTLDPGRDQNAVSPLVPKEKSEGGV
jgi:hypothetical protein